MDLAPNQTVTKCAYNSAEGQQAHIANKAYSNFEWLLSRTNEFRIALEPNKFDLNLLAIASHFTTNSASAWRERRASCTVCDLGARYPAALSISAKTSSAR